MLQVTTAAATALAEVRDAQDLPDSYGVRIAAQPDPSGQVGIALQFAEVPEAGDEVTPTDGPDVYVAPELAEPLSGSLIDVDDTPEGPQLVIKPQSAAS